VPSYRPLIREIACPPSPLDAFSAVRDRPGAALLQSAAGDPKLGRWSFLACDPFLTFRSKGPRIEIHRPGGVEVRQADPFAVLRDLLLDIHVERPPHAPPLIAGALGYFAYDLGRFVERIPEQTTDDVPVADCHLGFYGAILAVDHVENRAFISTIGAPETDPAAARKLAEQRASGLSDAIAQADPGPPAATPRRSMDTLPITSNFTHSDYIKAVARAKAYIAAGDIYQVNLSQRLSAPPAPTPLPVPSKAPVPAARPPRKTPASPPNSSPARKTAPRTS
jgi:para-aminobenzoate synthetase component 1